MSPYIWSQAFIPRVQAQVTDNVGKDHRPPTLYIYKLSPEGTEGLSELAPWQPKFGLPEVRTLAKEEMGQDKMCC